MAKTINARFKVYTGLAAQWSVSAVILMKGEIGLETDTGLFKFGNGTSQFKDLPYANNYQNVTKLSDLEDDATHRLVTDTEKAAWNAKVDQTTYNSKVQELETSIGEKVAQSAYDEKVADLESSIAGKVAQSAYDTKIGEIDAQLATFITKAVDDLENYYNKTAIDGKVTDLENKISAVPKFDIKVVDALPTSDISYTTIYLVKAAKGDTENLYVEYIRIKGEAGAADSWEKLGEQKVDLSGYLTTEAFNAAIAEYVKSSELAAIAKTGKLSDATDDATHRLVTDEEKAAWNAKANAGDIVKVSTGLTDSADLVRYADEIVIDGGELTA